MNFETAKPISEVATAEITAKKTLSFTDKWHVFETLGKELAANKQITISPSHFADCCMVALYCESNLETNAVSGDQQGIFQSTADTRRRLNLPSNILNDGFCQQVEYFKKFILASGKTRYIKDAVDLHAMNFAPSRFHRDTICSAENLPQLDKDQNGVITRQDLILFQAKRVQENTFVRKIWKKIQA